jgi:uncharacterized protein YggE
MKKFTFLLLLLLSTKGFSQKNYIDLPFIETSATEDTLITPDRIYIEIIISEKDSKGKISVEELENKMNSKLESLGIDIKKQLTLNDLSSNFKRYFLKQHEINKSKSYSLIVYEAKTAGKALAALEEIGISNVNLSKTEYSKAEAVKLSLKSKAIVKAKNQALAMTKPLNQKVGTAIYISDLTSPSFGNGLAGSASGIIIRGYSSTTNTEPTDIDIQKIKLEVELNVKFKLE